MSTRDASELKRGTSPIRRLVVEGAIEPIEPQHADAEAAHRHDGPSGIIVVPDMAAVDLTALTKKELGLTYYLDHGYAHWDYYLGNDGASVSGRGKRFQWELWSPRQRAVSSNRVQKHFAAKGLRGHVGAFMQWCRAYRVEGYYASIPEDNGCLRAPDGRLHAPCFCLGDHFRRFGQRSVRVGWAGYWSFVGFREVP